MKCFRINLREAEEKGSAQGKKLKTKNAKAEKEKGDEDKELKKWQKKIKKMEGAVSGASLREDSGVYAGLVQGT